MGKLLSTDVERLENGNMIFKIDFEFTDDVPGKVDRDDVFDSFLESAYDNDCEIWGDEFCISNYEMGMCLYSWYFDRKYIIPFSDFDKLANGETVELIAIELDESDRECWEEEFGEN